MIAPAPPSPVYPLVALQKMWIGSGEAPLTIDHCNLITMMPSGFFPPSNGAAEGVRRKKKHQICLLYDTVQLWLWYAWRTE